MLSLQDVSVVARRELTRNLRSSKGVAMFALFFLGGFLPAIGRLILTRLVGGMTAEQERKGLILLLSNFYNDEATVKHLAHAPPTIFVLFYGTIVFIPLFVLLLGFDNISGELQHRALRYSAARASRSSIVVGKALGIWALLVVMTTVLHLTVWVIAIVHDPHDANGVFSWGGRFLLFSWVAASAYVGFTSLMSTIFKTPIVALLSGGGIGFAIWLLFWRLSLNPETRGITWLFPNRYETLLVLPDGGQVALGLALLVVWGAVMVAASWFVLSRKDV